MVQGPYMPFFVSWLGCGMGEWPDLPPFVRSEVPGIVPGPYIPSLSCV